MLKSRVITALLLAPLVFIAVLALPTTYFALVITAIVLLAAVELARLGGLRHTPRLVAYTLLQGLALVLMYQLLDSQYLAWIVYVLAVWWLLVLLVLLSRQWAVGEKKGLNPLVLSGGMLLLTG